MLIFFLTRQALILLGGCGGLHNPHNWFDIVLLLQFAP